MPALSALLSFALFHVFLPKQNGERRLNECILPTECDIIEASNRVTDHAKAHRKVEIYIDKGSALN